MDGSWLHSTTFRPSSGTSSGPHPSCLLWVGVRYIFTFVPGSLCGTSYLLSLLNIKYIRQGAAIRNTFSGKDLETCCLLWRIKVEKHGDILKFTMTDMRCTV